MIVEELGLVGNTSATYTKIEDHLTPDTINKHQTDMKAKFDIEVDDEMSTLPDIYWIPNLHKNPVQSTHFTEVGRLDACRRKTFFKELPTSNEYDLINRI